MKAIVTILFILSAIQTRCQTIKEAGDLYTSGKYAEALDMATKMIENGSNPAFANGLIGRIYVDQGNYIPSIPFLQKAIKLDRDSTYISGWSHACLGKAYLMTNEKARGVLELKKAIGLNKTTNSVRYAQNILDYSSLEPHWVIIEGKYLTYYFQDTVNISEKVKRYIQLHEEAYVKINETFKAILPNKIVFYVWNDRVLAKQLLHQELGFTNPETCTINVDINQTIGHEITHALSYWGWGYRPENRTSLINEGVAVAFDQNRVDKNEIARKAVTGKNIHSILDVWENVHMDENIIYPLGGAFVHYLYTRCTPKQFEKIIKDQTISNARKVLGKQDFDMLIKDFDIQMGFQ